MNGAPKHIANCYQKLQREAWNKISLLSFQRNQYCLHLDFHNSRNQEIYFPLFSTNSWWHLGYSCPNKATWAVSGHFQEELLNLVCGWRLSLKSIHRKKH